jgi:N-acetylneuraminic acid mutarotase
LSSTGPTFRSGPPAEVSWRRRALALIGLVLVLGVAWGLSHGGRRSGAPTARASHAPSRPAPATAPSALLARVSARLPAPVQDPAAATDAHGSTVLIGGLSAADVSVAGIELTDGSSAHPAGALPAALHDATAASIGGQIYFFGGGDTGSSDQILRIAPGASAAVVGHLPAPASDVAAATIGDTAYVAGGYTGQTPLATIVAWRPGTAAHVVARLPTPIRYAAVAVSGGKLVIAGGTTPSGASAAVYEFDPASGAVARIASLPRPLTHAAAASLGRFVYVIGGRGVDLSSQTSQILAVDPTAGTVKPAGRLPVALSDAAAIATAGRILVAGGRDPRGEVHADVLTLTPR